MADIVLTADTNQAVNALKRVQDQAQSLQNKFSGLRNAVAGLALGALIQNTIRLADSIQDVSDVTGVAVQNILGFQNAVVLNGGSAQQASDAIYKLSDSIADATQGSKTALNAFEKAGVSLRDLGTLSEQDLLTQTIDGLSKIEDNSLRAAAGIALFGKNFKGVNIQGVNNDLARTTAESQKMAQAVKNTAEMQQKLDSAMLKLQSAILKVIQPLVNFINKLDDDQIEKFINAVVQLGAALAVLSSISIAIRALGASIQALGSAAASFAGMGLAVVGLVGILKTFQITLSVLARYSIPAWIAAVKSGTSLMAAFAATGLMLSKRFGYLLGSIIQLVAGLGRLIIPLGLLVTKIYLVIDAIRQLGEGKTFGDILDDWAYRLEKFVTDSMPMLAKFINKLGDAMGMAPSPMSNQGRSRGIGGPTAAEMTEYHNQQNKGLQENKARQDEINKAIKDALDPAKEIVKQYGAANAELMSQLNLQTNLVGKTQDQVEQDQLRYDVNSRIGKTLEDLVDLQTKLSQGSLAEQEAAKQISQYIEQIRNSRQKVVDAALEELRILQTARDIDASRVKILENLVALEERRNNLATDVNAVMGDLNKKVQDAKVANEQALLTPLQRQRAEINRNIDLLENEMVGKLTQAFSTEDGVGDPQGLSAAIQRVKEQTAALRQEQLSGLETSQTWSAGWTTAFNEYYENATNAATMAQDAFSSFTNAMESAIDRFVQTGKFSFKDFAKSVIADLIKIQLKAATMKFLSAMGMGNPFAGFFADGGYIPPGKYGVVGEAGPELVSGPAQVTPAAELGGQVVNNYITNNISAVDAKSVAVLFAQNRKTLFGATETARKEMPTRMRR